MSKSSANNKLISKRPYGRFFVYTIIAYALLFDAYFEHEYILQSKCNTNLSPIAVLQILLRGPEREHSYLRRATDPAREPAPIAGVNIPIRIA